ncbi:MAG: H/ACA ribonucleoprotein complex subunit GAR1 [Candidatus Odinarchaeia archaeon]
MGRVIHCSPHGRLILRSTFTPPLGAPVVTKDGRKVGLVFDIFGPVKLPYISIRVSGNLKKPDKLIGHELFLAAKRRNKRSPKIRNRG